MESIPTLASKLDFRHRTGDLVHRNKPWSAGYCKICTVHIPPIGCFGAGFLGRGIGESDGGSDMLAPHARDRDRARVPYDGVRQFVEFATAHRAGLHANIFA